MLHLGSTYLIVKDMEKSISFYQTLLSMEPTQRNLDRWTQFEFGGNCIALYNPAFDDNMIKNQQELTKHYSPEYLNDFKKKSITYGNNFVLNFWVEDLKKEHGRIIALNLGPVSEIKYVNIATPYYFFTIHDPDGNTVEITGNYNSVPSSKKEEAAVYE